MLMLISMIMLMSVLMLMSMLMLMLMLRLMLMLTKLPSNKTPELGADFGRILDHFGIIFGDSLGCRRPPKSDFERESLSYRFLIAFWRLLGPLLEAMLRPNRPRKLSKVTFFDFLTLPKSIKISKTFWHRFGTLLDPSWDRFGLDFERFLEPKIDVKNDLRKMQKVSPRRGESSKIKVWRASKKHQKSISKRLPKLVHKMFNKSAQKSPKMVPRATQEGPKMRSKFNFNFKRQKKYAIGGIKNAIRKSIEI